MPKADLYILARVLHDWSDEKVNILLNKIAEACTPGKVDLNGGCIALYYLHMCGKRCWDDYCAKRILLQVKVGQGNQSEASE